MCSVLGAGAKYTWVPWFSDLAAHFLLTPSLSPLHLPPQEVLVSHSKKYVFSWTCDGCFRTTETDEQFAIRPSLPEGWRSNPSWGDLCENCCKAIDLTVLLRRSNEGVCLSELKMGDKFTIPDEKGGEVYQVMHHGSTSAVVVGSPGDTFQFPIKLVVTRCS